MAFHIFSNQTLSTQSAEVLRMAFNHWNESWDDPPSTQMLPRARSESLQGHQICTFLEGFLNPFLETGTYWWAHKL